MSKHHTLGASERLKSRKRIEQLFNAGKPIVLAPFRIFLEIGAGTGQLQAGFGVSSRNFRKAVQRNRVKRITREAWRLQKKELQEALVKNQQDLFLFILYTGREIPSYSLVSEKMGKILNRLTKMVHENNPAGT